MREYEVEVVQKVIVYVEAENEAEAMNLAQIEAIRYTPDSVDCHILSSTDLDDEDLNICGEHGCDGCLYQHRNDIDICKQEAERKKTNGREETDFQCSIQI